MAEDASQAFREDSVHARPHTKIYGRSLWLRHVLPKIGFKVIARGIGAVINHRRQARNLPVARFVRCDRSVVIRGVDKVVLEGGIFLGPNVTLDTRTGGRGIITLGNNAVVHNGSIISAAGGRVTVGDEAYIGPYCVLYGTGGLTIGAEVMVGPHCLFVANNHGLDPESPFRRQPLTAKGIRIERNVWIGGHATILDGVSIGEGSVVAAGAVVTCDVPARVLVCGVPARVKRALTRRNEGC